MRSPKSTGKVSVSQYNMLIFPSTGYKYCFANTLTKYILYSNSSSFFFDSSMIVSLWSVLPVTYEPNQTGTGSKIPFLWLLPVFPVISFCVFDVFTFCCWETLTLIIPFDAVTPFFKLVKSLWAGNSFFYLMWNFISILWYIRCWAYDLTLKG